MIKSPQTQSDKEFNEFMKREKISNRIMIGLAIAITMGAVGLLITFLIHQN